MLLGVELAQGAVGFVQYATDLPVVLVGVHLLGAALGLGLRDVGTAAGTAAGAALPLACGDGHPRRSPILGDDRPGLVSAALGTDQCPWRELGAQRDVAAGRQVRRASSW